MAKKSSSEPREIRSTKELNEALGNAAKTTNKEEPVATAKAKKSTNKKSTSNKKTTKKSPAKKATAAKKETKKRIGGNNKFKGFGEGTKLATIYSCLKSGKFTRDEMIKAVQEAHPDDSPDATKRTCQVQLSHYRKGKYGYELIEQKNGKLRIKDAS